MIELLSPAGNEESLISAVSKGADAVYFGGEFLNARMSADNFDKEKIREYSLYCKNRNVKSYLTLNTVVSDNEINDLKDYIEFINSTDISALIVQSRGLLMLVKEIAPCLPVHTSTQATVHSLDGALEAKKLGFERVVLSRELSKENISLITEKSGVETEVFIHGALCMCYSGQCYFSSMIGTRSGNRGRCAQPCRQMYKNGYELSLKDLCMAQNFEEFLKLNVTSFKIEGRLKSKEYIGGVTSVYRKLIDEKRNATKDEIEYLKSLFSRQGFTNDYFLGSPSKKMFGIRTDYDKDLSKSIKTEFKEKKILADIFYTFKKGQNIKVSASSMGKTVTKTFFEPEIAKNSPLTKSDFEERLKKTGNTPFEIASLKGEFDNGLFLPVSKINELRRDVLDLLNNSLKNTEKRPFYNKEIEIKEENNLTPMFNFHFLNEIKDIGNYQKLARHIWVRLDKFKDKKYDNMGVSLPVIIKDTEKDNVLKMLLNAKNKGILKVLCHTPGQIDMIKNLGLTPYASYSFNAYNSLDILSLKQLGAKELTVSFELSLNKIKALKKSIPLNLIAYGRMPVMITENCIIKNAKECIDFNGFYNLKDKTGASFPVMCYYPHKNIILNSVPINLSDKTDEIKDAGISGLDMFFTDEENPCEIIKGYLDKASPKGNFTRGLYYRKVL